MFELIFSWIGFSSYLSLLTWIYDAIVYFLFKEIEPSLDIVFWIFLPLYLFFYFTVFFHFWKLVKKLLKIENINFWNFTKPLTRFHVVLPVLLFIYPFLLWLTNTKFKNHRFHILFWVILWLFLFIYRNIVGLWYVNGIGLLYFLPIILVFLLSYKVKSNIWEGFNFVWIFLCILILLTQPFYKSWFFDKNNPSNQKICYSRDFHGGKWGTCFKIFKWFEIR